MTAHHPEADLLRAVAVDVAREAAAYVARSRASSGPEVTATKSSATDVVTRVDTDTERLVRRLLSVRRAGDTLLGEEGGEEPLVEGSPAATRTSVRWIVDPIDGTVNFLYGIPQYAVSVAAEVDGVVVAGAVHDVTRDESWSAAKDRGASLDGAPLAVRAVPPLAESLVLTGFSYDPRTRALQGSAVAQLLPRVRDIRRMGSAALDICAVAAGRADAYVEEGPQLWDHAAAGLIATEAGARLSLLEGAGGATLVLVVPEDGHDAVLEVVSTCGFLAGPVRPTTR
ncbi:inositol monophosphatase [Nocardioidaceae bacterium]|nr:inositol monophosphatase [Nocardioidaceae bacterium]